MRQMILLAILLCIATVLAYIRLAPSDAEVWHIPLDPRPALLGAPSPDAVVPLRNGAYTDLPSGLFEQLKSIAAATPRTTVLVQEAGRITWITRSSLMGFPDYTTAQITPHGLTVFARQRFGLGDRGVNAARLTLWRKLLLKS